MFTYHVALRPQALINCATHMQQSPTSSHDRNPKGCGKSPKILGSQQEAVQGDLPFTRYFGSLSLPPHAHRYSLYLQPFLPSPFLPLSLALRQGAVASS